MQYAMPATPTNSPDACESADPNWALDWALDHVDADGETRDLTVRVTPPVFCAEPFTAWRTVVVLKGAYPPEVPIYGATAIQSLTLALSMAVNLLSPIADKARLTDRATGEPVTRELLEASLSVATLDRP